LLGQVERVDEAGRAELLGVRGAGKGARGGWGQASQQLGALGLGGGLSGLGFALVTKASAVAW
jgi:hypothetical protein